MPIASHIAATGLIAAQTRIDVVAQNLANLKTVAYQQWMATTSDTFYQQVTRAGIPVSANAVGTRPVGVQIGTGTEVTGVYRVINNYAPTVQTKNPLDMAIVGAGYFAINLPNDQLAYTRAGTFQIGKDRALYTVNGYPLADGITIPDDVQVSTVTISDDGVIKGKDGTNADVDIGQIQIFTFANERGMEAIGNNLFITTDASGDATGFVPGTNGTGVIKGGYLEESGVSAVTELTDLIDAQRAYEYNSKVLMASNEMQKTAGDIYKG